MGRTTGEFWGSLQSPEEAKGRGNGSNWLAKSSEGFHVILKSPKLDGENENIKLKSTY
jgi:hypothetical protein